jgi:hypothetical protein
LATHAPAARDAPPQWDVCLQVDFTVDCASLLIVEGDFNSCCTAKAIS